MRFSKNFTALTKITTPSKKKIPGMMKSKTPDSSEFKAPHNIKEPNALQIAPNSSKITAEPIVFCCLFVGL